MSHASGKDRSELLAVLMRTPGACVFKGLARHGQGDAGFLARAAPGPVNTVQLSFMAISKVLGVVTTSFERHAIIHRHQQLI